jgi:MFS family permease
MKLDVKRWLILFAGILANLCQGTAYASSVFAGPILKQLNLMTAAGKPDITKWALAFSINLGCLPIGMLLSGKIADKHGPRVVVGVAGTIFGLGMLLSGFSTTYVMFLLTFGVMMGIGSGAAYGAVVSTSVRWFPERRGLASGISVGALGFGTVLIAPIGAAMVAKLGVMPTLNILGGIFIVIMILTSLVMVNPPAGYCPAGFTPKAGAAASEGKTWIEMITTGRFWLLFAMYACGAFAGLMIISQARQIAGGLEYFEGLKATKGEKEALAIAGTFAVSVVSLLGLANAGGRVLWGFISDKIGRLPALAIMFVLTAIALAILPRLQNPNALFVGATLLVGLCYGGYLGIFPSLCADAFGARNLTVNYAVLFSSFSLAAIAGPYAAGAVKASSGTYTNAFYIAAAVAVAGLVVTVISMIAAKSKPAA